MGCRTPRPGTCCATWRLSSHGQRTTRCTGDGVLARQGALHGRRRWGTLPILDTSPGREALANAGQLEVVVDGEVTTILALDQPSEADDPNWIAAEHVMSELRGSCDPYTAGGGGPEPTDVGST